MFLIEEKELWSVYIIVLGMVVPIVILAFVAFVIALVKRSKTFKGVRGQKSDEDFNPEEYFKDSVVEEDYSEVNDIFGEGNIINVECEMSRVTIEVKDIDLVKIQALQEKGADGILLVGNKLKCNFKENSEEIAEYLKGAINND